MSKTVYDHQTIEEKWQQSWEEQQLFQQSEQDTDSSKPKSYLLFAFAYPSGSGLHVGHVESKTALDILARYKRMNGERVFFPVGWDAFGLPAENYAVKTGVHPAETTKNAINEFRRQIKRIGISYDWANEIATNHPEYYKWTQWIFLQLHKKGLAYQKMGAVNWCPSCQTVLANEQVVNGACERCGTEVIQKEMKQWFFKITEYKDELISGLDQVDWPNATKQQQLNWIGRSEGAEVKFQVAGSSDHLTVYTTAHDTIYGCTFMVIAPEHKFLQEHKVQIKNWSEVEQYIEETKKKTELDRQIQKEKTGVKVEGLSLINPVNDQEIPLYVADYVLVNYGTGVVMAVPGQDDRDNEFAQKYNLPIIFTTHKNEFVTYSDIKENRKGFTLANSGEFDGLDYEKGREAIMTKLIELRVGEKKNQYKLRDWLISRQRYWGAPIPVVYDPEGNAHPVKEEHLPWMLPTDVEFKPTGESPLTYSKEFKERVETLYGKGWRPEYDTMDTFVDSSWYFLRYVDSRNSDVFANPDQLKAWLPVDFYMIGPEHIVLHLLYSRFFTKFLRDEGYLNFDEPFMKMRHQGMILGPDGRKMSKSKGNVINPDEVIEKYGADTLRVYEMFMGPIEADKPWSTSSVVGIYRFLNRIHTLVVSDQWSVIRENTEQSQQNPNTNHQTLNTPLKRKLHQTIQKVTRDIPDLKFNTAIAAMMELVNAWEDEVKKVSDKPNSPTAQQLILHIDDVKAFIKILCPFAPFLAEELWHQIAGENEPSIHTLDWPKFDPDLIIEEEVTIVIQVNGKVRGQIQVSSDQIEDKEAIVSQAKADSKILPWLDGKSIKKEVYIPGKLVSLVVA